MDDQRSSGGVEIALTAPGVNVRARFCEDSSEAVLCGPGRYEAQEGMTDLKHESVEVAVADQPASYESNSSSPSPLPRQDVNDEMVRTDTRLVDTIIHRGDAGETHGLVGGVQLLRDSSHTGQHHYRDSMDALEDEAQTHHHVAAPVEEAHCCHHVSDCFVGVLAVLQALSYP